jgi:hypothetical protein
MENFNKSSSKSYWEYVHADDFQVPETTVDRTVKKRLFSFLNILKSRDNQDSKPLISKDETSAIDESRLSDIITTPDWKKPAAALDEALEDWLKSQKTEEPFKLILGPPFSGHTETLITWADSHSFRIMIPPSADQILHQDMSYFEQFNKSDSLWVIPGLEKLFFRHTKGLDLVRRLIDGLFTGKIPPGVIGCDTWAWAFFCHVLEVESLSPLIPQAFQSEQMTNFLTEIISRDSENKTVFRRMGDGKLVLNPYSLKKSKSQTESPECPWIKVMTEHCRGNPGIALEYWRRSLRTMTWEEGDEKPSKKFNDDFVDNNAVWVIAWDKLHRPSIPNDMSRDHARVLYTLLIHGGLPEKLLYLLLPFSVHESARFLRFLQSGELIEKSFEIWRVSPFAFPVTGDYLYAEGYPRGL